MSQTVHCSFCRKADTAVSRLIAGPGVFICDACIILCARALMQCAPQERGATARIECGADCSTETLLDQLKGQEAMLMDLKRRLIANVETLRARDVSWEKIGKALGCSRQAAWEKFGALLASACPIGKRGRKAETENA